MQRASVGRGGEVGRLGGGGLVAEEWCWQAAWPEVYQTHLTVRASYVSLTMYCSMIVWNCDKASLEATLVQNYDPLTDSLKGVKCRATSVVLWLEKTLTAQLSKNFPRRPMKIETNYHS